MDFIFKKVKANGFNIDIVIKFPKIFFQNEPSVFKKIRNLQLGMSGLGNIANLKVVIQNCVDYYNFVDKINCLVIFCGFHRKMVYS